jgi:hypothetical protein
LKVGEGSRIQEGGLSKELLFACAGVRMAIYEGIPLAANTRNEKKGPKNPSPG